MASDELWLVEELRWHDERSRFFRVWREGGETTDVAIIQRHGKDAEMATCIACDQTIHHGLACVHLQAFKREQFLDYDDTESG